MANEKLFDLLWSNVLPEPNTGCWLWVGDTAALAELGTLSGEGAPTELELAWYATHGMLPARQVVYSSCSQICCNPAHLRLRPRDPAESRPAG